ncbi:UDP-N-acetylglucosamine--N-acetylmuramyl-(pentapeptide) pyrophosphoryl-undecaprenol N-acetylglucosamine transferase [Nocardia panacis]|uniref:UDP-N-acetylglucosamine--N-acetylmuramyl- (pentapeptide) pyrophosphoryl-undecaprenol N-acetylglucosamine transferase n=1 Tax=Nocardia panacis TaxID=2340916 RepID=UPI00249DFD20|nr:UDP-N-acetylglucosamine--N-acetylmuramyl-(pentapeptide) pyrophosphoryl-undecaprenol N-acetylglucosamine transferase [Nocardia panacis]
MIVAGGGTGGHTYPAAAVIRALRTLVSDAGAAADVLWVGTPDSLEQRVAVENRVDFAPLRAGRLRRDHNPLRMLTDVENIKDALRLPGSVIAAILLVAKFRPDVVIATGGYVAVPVGVAAALLRRPLLIHEQTSGIGKANELLAPVATRIAVSSAASLELLRGKARDRAVVTGNPIRAALMAGDPQAAVRALEWGGYTPELPTVYVTGGAQGACQINDLIIAILPELLQVANVVHQCGRTSFTDINRHAETLPGTLRARYQLHEFIDVDLLADIFALADIVVSRSGAGTLAELTALGKPSVLIPYPHSVGGEQARGAEHLADHHAARALIGNDATTDRLRAELFHLLFKPATRTAMSMNAAAMGHPNAAAELAVTALDLAMGF